VASHEIQFDQGKELSETIIEDEDLGVEQFTPATYG